MFEKGFSLIEVMITMTIIAILASVSWPSYQDYMRKSRRVEAENALLQLQLKMESFYSVRLSYSGAAKGGDDSGEPEYFHSHTPFEEGSKKHYKLLIVSASNSEYWLQAEPLEHQKKDECGVLVLHSSGRKGSASELGSCWNGTSNIKPS